MMYKKGGKAKDVQGVIDEFYNIRAGWQLMFDDLGTAMGKDALQNLLLFGKKLKIILDLLTKYLETNLSYQCLIRKPTEQAVKK